MAAKTKKPASTKAVAATKMGSKDKAKGALKKVADKAKSKLKK